MQVLTDKSQIPQRLGIPSFFFIHSWLADWVLVTVTWSISKHLQRPNKAPDRRSTYIRRPLSTLKVAPKLNSPAWPSGCASVNEAPVKENIRSRASPLPLSHQVSPISHRQLYHLNSLPLNLACFSSALPTLSFSLVTSPRLRHTTGQLWTLQGDTFFFRVLTIRLGKRV